MIGRDAVVFVGVCCPVLTMRVWVRVFETNLGFVNEDSERGVGLSERR